MTECALHHGYPLNYYCDSCHDAACQRCISEQPHSDSCHIVRPLQEADTIRQEHFKLLEANKIHPIRHLLARKIIQIKKAAQQQAAIKEAIQADTLSELSAIGVRLDKTQLQVRSDLQTHIRQHEERINQIDDIAYTFETVHQDPYRLLSLFRDLNKKITELELNVQTETDQTNNTAESPLKSEIVPQDVIQKKTEQFRFYNQQYNKLITYAVSQHRTRLKEASKNQHEVAKRCVCLYTQLNMMLLNRFKPKMCVFCGFSCNIDAVNSECHQNKSLSAPVLVQRICVPNGVRGNRQHYWVTPTLKDMAKPSKDAHPLVQKRLRELYQQGLVSLRVLKPLTQLKHYLAASFSQKKLIPQSIFSIMKAVGESLVKLTARPTAARVQPKENESQWQIGRYCSVVAFKYEMMRNLWRGISEDLVQLVVSQCMASIPAGQSSSKTDQDLIDLQAVCRLLENPVARFEEYRKTADELQSKLSVGPSSTNRSTRKY